MCAPGLKLQLCLIRTSKQSAGKSVAGLAPRKFDPKIAAADAIEFGDRQVVRKARRPTNQETQLITQGPLCADTVAKVEKSNDLENLAKVDS
jgi:hypothetical protein